jgi:hypothetical protein
VLHPPWFTGSLPDGVLAVSIYRKKPMSVGLPIVPALVVYDVSSAERGVVS